MSVEEVKKPRLKFGGVLGRPISTQRVSSIHWIFHWYHLPPNLSIGFRNRSLQWMVINAGDTLKGVERYVV